MTGVPGAGEEVDEMGYNPENLEAPNSSEKPPVKQPSDAVIRGLGQTAVKGR